MRALQISLAALLFVASSAFGEEFNGSCAYGLSTLGMDVKTDCSVRWADPATGKIYCFGNEEVLASFLKNPSDNVRKAELVYAKFHSK